MGTHKGKLPALTQAPVHLPDIVLHEVFLNAKVPIRILKNFRNVNRHWNSAACRVLKTRAGSMLLENHRQVDYLMSELQEDFQVLQVPRFSLNLNTLGIEQIKIFFNHTNECDLAKLSLHARCWSALDGLGISVYRNNGEKLAHCLNSCLKLRHLHLNLNQINLPLPSCRFDFPNLHRLDFIFQSESTFYSEDALITQIIETAPRLKTLVLELVTPSFRNNEPPNPSVRSILRKVPEWFSQLPGDTKVFLSIKGITRSTEWEIFNNPDRELERWKPFFELVVSQLVTISWTAFELSFDSELAKESGPLIRKHAPTLRKLSTGLDPSWTMNTVPFSKCRVLEVMISEVPPSETLYQLFPSVYQLVLNGSESMIGILDEFASKLPKLGELVLRQANWQSLTALPVKTVSEVFAVVKSSGIVRSDYRLLSNPLAKLESLKTLALDSSCDGTAFDWILYISAVGGLRRMKISGVGWVFVACLKNYAKLIYQFHDEVKMC